MSFKKPFRAVPLKPSAHYAEKLEAERTNLEKRTELRKTWVFAGWGLIAGVVMGLWWIGVLS